MASLAHVLLQPILHVGCAPAQKASARKFQPWRYCRRIATEVPLDSFRAAAKYGSQFLQIEQLAHRSYPNWRFGTSRLFQGGTNHHAEAHGKKRREEVYMGARCK